MKKLLRYLLYKTKFGEVTKKYSKIKNFPYLPKEVNEQKMLSKLNSILNYAYQNIRYYHELFDRCGIVKNGQIELKSKEELQKIPFLTKDIINKQKENLYSKEIKSRKAFKSTSGGSTGEPVIFMQDKEYLFSTFANFHIAESWRGAGLYESRLILWGAERDTYEGKKPLRSHLIDFVSNTTTLNTFSMTEEDMRRYIEIINRKKPALIITYVQSIHELAKFAKENNIEVKKQRAIHVSAGTLHEYMRVEIEEVFGCGVYNYYGSREVGAIASECNAHNGLHIMSDNTLLEVIDKDGNLCQAGEEGEIVVTTLNNYSMPLIRYRIGDIGIMQEYSECSCGCTYPKLQKIVGRTIDVFHTKDGAKVDGAFFIYQFYFRNWVKNYQVIQESLEQIVIKLVKKDKVPKEDLTEIEKNVKHVMGKDCEVVFEFVPKIEKSKTGKFLYTYSKVKEPSKKRAVA